MSGTYPIVPTTNGVRIVDMPDLGVVTDDSSVVGEHAGSGRFGATALRDYVATSFPIIWVTQPAYNAKGDGVTDDTAAIQAALSTGKHVYFPPGTYRISAPLTLIAAGQTVFGAGSGSTITTTSATADMLVITGNYLNLYGLAFRSSVTRTAGAAVNVNAGYVHLHDFIMEYYYIGVLIQGNSGGVHVSHGFILSGRPNGVGVRVTGGIDLVLDNLLITSFPPPTVPSAIGVDVDACGDLTLDHVSTVYMSNGVVVSPAAGAIVQTVNVLHCYFDTGTGAGIVAQPVGTVQLLHIADTWVASNATGGVVLNAIGAGQLQQTDIVNSIVSNNTGVGINIAAPGVANTNIIGTAVSANTSHGISINNGISNFRIADCTCGPSGEFAGNGGAGIVLQPSCDRFTIHDNNLLGNSGGSLSAAGSPGGTLGVTNFVSRNLGFVTQNSGILTTTAGPTSFVINHGLGIAPLPQDIVLSPASGWGGASSYWWTSLTATTFTIVFNVAPGPNVAISWRVRVWGA